MSRNDGSGGAIRMPSVIERLREVGAERGAQVPQRLAPDLAVGVDLGPVLDRAEVAVRVAAVRARRRRGADRAVERLRPQLPRRGVDVVADVHLPRRRQVAEQVEAGHQVERVPVAPALPHRAGLRARQRGRAVAVGDQPARQAVRVLVPDDGRRVARVDAAEAGPGEAVQLHRRGRAVGQRRHARVVEPRGVRLDLDGVDAGEAVGGVREADVRVVGQVIVEAADEVEGLDRVLLAVRRPTSSASPGPTSSGCSSRTCRPGTT